MCRQDDPEVQEAAGDVLMGEQTWPSEEEMAAAIEDTMAASGAGRNRRKLQSSVIPAGMSGYQADWLVDDEGQLASDEEEGEGEGGEEEEEEEEEEGDDAMEGGAEHPAMLPPVGMMAAAPGWENEAEDDDITLDGSILDVARPLGQNVLEKRKVQAKDDDQFPDEVRPSPANPLTRSLSCHPKC
jgi:pre-rRNA-processing protein TSR1